MLQVHFWRKSGLYERLSQLIPRKCAYMYASVTFHAYAHSKQSEINSNIAWDWANIICYDHKEMQTKVGSTRYLKKDGSKTLA